MEESKSRRPVPSNNLSNFIGFIILPPDISRDDYVENFLKKEICSVIDLEFYRVVHNVRIGRNVLKDIQIPSSVDKLGSAVLCLNLEIREQYIIIDTIKAYEDSQLQQLEDSYRITRKRGLIFTDFHIKPGELDMIVDSGEQSLESTWSFFNKKRQAFLKIYIQGIFHLIAEKVLNIVGYEVISINITKEGEKQIELSLEKDKGVKYTDKFKNSFTIDQNGNIQFSPKKKFIVGSGKYSVLLGEIMKDAVDNIIDELGKSTVTTILGPMPLLNAAAIIAIKQKTAKTLSKYSFTQ